jgi:fibronectin-binding autotransporter adhesin
MATTSWKSGVSGNWQTAADWTGGAAPNGVGTSVAIAAPGSYSVSLSDTDSYAVDALTLADTTGTLNIAGALSVTALVNSGTIALSGALASLLVTTSVHNSGLIEVSNDAALWLGAGSSLANTGTIALTTGGTLLIATSLALGALGRIVNTGGLVDVYGAGTLDLHGGSLTNAPTGALSSFALDGGTVRNGTVVASGGGMSLYGTLDTVAWLGALTVGPQQALTLTGGFSLTGAQKSAGNLTLSGGRLVVADSETLDNFTLVAAPPAGSFDYIQNAAAQDGVPGGTLSFGPGFVLRQTAGETYLQDPGAAAALNAGKFQIAGGTLHVLDGSLTNVGTIAIGAGAVIQVGSRTTMSSSGLILANGGAGNAMLTFTIGSVGSVFTNLSGGVFTGGTLEADGGSTLEISASGTLATDNASIVLNGVGSAIRAYDPVGHRFDDIRTTLTTVGGTLTLAGGVTFTDTLALRDAGSIVLAAGVLFTPALTVAAGGALSGTGTITGTQGGRSVFDGLVTAKGGLLKITGPISGVGTLAIAAGATLEVGGSDSAGIAFSGVATLQLDSATPIAGSIGGLAAGDTIVLEGANATAATLSGGSLTVALARGAPKTFKASGSAALVAKVTQDGSGNSIIAFSAAALTLAPMSFATIGDHLRAAAPTPPAPNWTTAAHPAPVAPAAPWHPNPPDTAALAGFAMAHHFAAPDPMAAGLHGAMS